MENAFTVVKEFIQVQVGLSFCIFLCHCAQEEQPSVRRPDSDYLRPQIVSYLWVDYGTNFKQ